MLNLIKQRLELLPGVSVSEKGKAAARFLHIATNERAIVVAEDGERGIWLEYWQKDRAVADDVAEVCAGEETVTSMEDAVKNVADWLNGKF